MENSEAGNKRERRVLDDKCRLREHSNSLKCKYICIIQIAEEEEKKTSRMFIWAKYSWKLPSSGEGKKH